jgi:hypothetical protein
MTNMEKEKKETSGTGNEPKVEFRRIQIDRYGEDGKGTTYPGVMGVAKDKSGREIAFSGCIEGFEAMIWSAAENKENLTEYLDCLLELFLEKSLHDNPGVSSRIADDKFYHN